VQLKIHTRIRVDDDRDILARFLLEATSLQISKWPTGSSDRPPRHQERERTQPHSQRTERTRFGNACRRRRSGDEGQVVGVTVVVGAGLAIHLEKEVDAPCAWGYRSGRGAQE
jgi:hypothetical protein